MPVPPSISPRPAPSGAKAPPRLSVDLLVAVSREYVVAGAGFLAGAGVFFAPLLFLGFGLLAAYLASVVSDPDAPVFALGRALTADDFRSVFAPAVNEAPLLLAAGVAGAVLGLFRRRQARKADPAFLAAGIRPFFPEYLLLYGLLVALTIGMAATHGGAPQLSRLALAAPVYLPFMFCLTWIAHVVWSYCFRNVMDLLATARDREAAGELRNKARLLRPARPR